MKCQKVSGSFFGIKRSKGYVKEVTVKQKHGSSLLTLCWEVFIGSPKHLQTPLYWILIVANNILTLTASTNNAFSTFLDKNPFITCFSMRDQNIPNCAMFDKRCNRYYKIAGKYGGSFHFPLSLRLLFICTLTSLQTKIQKKFETWCEYQLLHYPVIKVCQDQFVERNYCSSNLT